MSISDKIRQVNPRQRKSVKSLPVSEGGLGLSPRTSGSIEGDIKKAKENELAKYWYDKYEELVQEVSYHRKKDRQYLSELDEKVQDMNKDLLSEITTISESDPLTPLDQKFVTLDKFADHYRTMIGRLQEQIATIGGGGLGEIADDPAPKLGVNLDLNSKDITGTGNITHTGNITTSSIVISDAGNIGSASDTDAIAIAADGQVTVSQGLTVSGNLDISDTIYHTGDSNTKIRFPSVDTISFHTSGNEQMSIGSDGNVTFNNEVGIGSMSGQTIDSTVHIRAADAEITLQRIGDENTPGIIFQSNGGNARARIYMDGTDGTNKEIVFANKVNTTMTERFRVLLDGAKVSGNLEVTGAEIDFTALPTSDPSVAGRLWNDSGAVKVSAG